MRSSYMTTTLFSQTLPHNTKCTPRTVRPVRGIVLGDLTLRGHLRILRDDEGLGLLLDLDVLRERIVHRVSLVVFCGRQQLIHALRTLVRGDGQGLTGCQGRGL